MPQPNTQVRQQRVSSYQARIERSLTDIFFDVPAYERVIRTHPDGVQWTLVNVGHTNGWAVCELCGHRPIRRLFWIAPVITEGERGTAQSQTTDESRMLMIGSECAREYANVNLINTYLRRLTGEQNRRREATRREEQEQEWRREREERHAQWRSNNADVIEWLSDPAHLVDRRNPSQEDRFLTGLAHQVQSGGVLSASQTISARSNMSAYDDWFAERAAEMLRPIADEVINENVITMEAGGPIEVGNLVRRMASGRAMRTEHQDSVRLVGTAITSGIQGEMIRVIPGILTQEVAESAYQRLTQAADSASEADSVPSEEAQDDEEAAEAQAVADSTPATADDARMVYNGTYELVDDRGRDRCQFLIYTVRTGPLSGQRVIKARMDSAWKGFAFLTRSGDVRLWRRFQSRSDLFVEWLPAFGQLLALFHNEPVHQSSATATSAELQMTLRRLNVRCRICNRDITGRDRHNGVHDSMCGGDRWTPRNPAPQAEASLAEETAEAGDTDLQAVRARQSYARQRAAQQTAAQRASAGRAVRGTALLPPVENLPPLARDELGMGEIL